MALANMLPTCSPDNYLTSLTHLVAAVRIERAWQAKLNCNDTVATMVEGFVDQHACQLGFTMHMSLETGGHSSFVNVCAFLAITCSWAGKSSYGQSWAGVGQGLYMSN